MIFGVLFDICCRLASIGIFEEFSDNGCTLLKIGDSSSLIFIVGLRLINDYGVMIRLCLRGEYANSESQRSVASTCLIRFPILGLSKVTSNFLILIFELFWGDIIFELVISEWRHS